MSKQLNTNGLNGTSFTKMTILGCFVAACCAIGAASPASASYIAGDMTASGGIVTSVTGTSVTVAYDISKTAYIDSYFAKDEMGATTTAKIVVNGPSTSPKGLSVTRQLIAMPTIDGGSMTSAVLNLGCTQAVVGWSARAYALTQEWTEGTTTGGQTKSGSVAYGATWLTSDGSTAWAGTSGSRIMYYGTTGTAYVGGGGAIDALAYADATAQPVAGAWTTIDLTSIWNDVSANGVAIAAYNTTTGVTEDATQLLTGAWITEIFATDDWYVSTSGTFANVDASPFLSVTYAVPEPAALATLLCGAIAVVAIRKRNR